MQVRLQDGEILIADKVIVTIPLKILMDGDVHFEPNLSNRKTEAFSEVDMPPGSKMFIEFNTRFYPDVVAIAESGSDRIGDAIYYNASLNKNSSKYVLGLFCVGEPAHQFTRLNEETELLNHV